MGFAHIKGSMLQNILDSGVYNSTLWFVLLASLALTLRWRPREHCLVYASVLFFLIIGTAGNLFLSLYRAYTLPGDIIQDIVSAQEFLEGRPIYPNDMTAQIDQVLAREGPRGSLLDKWPAKRQREKEKLDEMLKEKWVQAHPPFMSLYTALFVWKLGILGTQIAFTFVALAALVLTLQMIRLELCPNVSFWNALLIGIAILGWDPVQGVLLARPDRVGADLFANRDVVFAAARPAKIGGDRNRHRDLVETGSRSHPSRAGTTASPGVLFRNTDDLGHRPGRARPDVVAGLHRLFPYEPGRLE